MKKLIDTIKKFRLIGYITVGYGMYQSGIETGTIVIEMFIMVLLVELASRRGKKVDPKSGEAKQMVKDYMKDID